MSKEAELNTKLPQYFSMRCIGEIEKEGKRRGGKGEWLTKMGGPRGPNWRVIKLFNQQVGWLLITLET